MIIEAKAEIKDKMSRMFRLESLHRLLRLCTIPKWCIINDDHTLLNKIDACMIFASVKTAATVPLRVNKFVSVQCTF
jgi:hypothetical protein